jgi:hypothetical protein
MVPTLARRDDDTVLTVLGPVVTSKGVCVWKDALGDPTEVAFVPAFHYLRSQPADVPVYFSHDSTWRLGSLEYLERDKRGLMGAARLDADVASLLEDGPWYFSAGPRCLSLGDSLYKYAVRLREVSLTRNPADRTLRPVVWARGDLARGECPAFGPPMSTYWRDTWKRAEKAMTDRRYRLVRSTDIHDVDPLDEVSEALTSGATLAEAAAIVHRRSAPPTPPRTGPVSTIHGHPLSREMSEVVALALSDPATEHLASPSDRILAYLTR